MNVGWVDLDTTIRAALNRDAARVRYSDSLSIDEMTGIAARAHMALKGVLDLCTDCDKITEESGTYQPPSTLAIRRTLAREFGIEGGS